MIALTDSPKLVRSPLKWAGSKPWLVSQFWEFWKPHQHRRYVDLFMGGATLPLNLQPERVLVNDLNPYLVLFWQWLQRGGERTFAVPNNSVEYYLLRDKFNQFKDEPDLHDWTAEAFWWLNRLGYNGLWRVNGKGFYNIPKGRSKTVASVNLKAYSGLVKGWRICWGDFEELELLPDDFVYADPPYDGTFSSYAADGFGWDDQVRLVEFLAQHPGPVVASNSVSDRILTLYQKLGFQVQIIQGRRDSLNSKAEGRTVKAEMLATKNL